MYILYILLFPPPWLSSRGGPNQHNTSKNQIYSKKKNPKKEEGRKNPNGPYKQKKEENMNRRKHEKEKL
jgi:hypothetical protein